MNQIPLKKFKNNSLARVKMCNDIQLIFQFKKNDPHLLLLIINILMMFPINNYNITRIIIKLQISKRILKDLYLKPLLCIN